MSETAKLVAIVGKSCPYVHCTCGACGCSIRLDGGCGCEDNRKHPIGKGQMDHLTRQQMILTHCCKMLGLEGWEWDLLLYAVDDLRAERTEYSSALARTKNSLFKMKLLLDKFRACLGSASDLVF